LKQNRLRKTAQKRDRSVAAEVEIPQVCQIFDYVVVKSFELGLSTVEKQKWIDEQGRSTTRETLDAPSCSTTSSTIPNTSWKDRFMRDDP
jgi:hypothetical protein